MSEEIETMGTPGSDLQLVPGSAEFSVGWQTMVRPVGDGRWHHKLYWVAQMPHQCDEFVVASGQTKAEVIAALEGFISDARAALEALRAHEEPDRPDLGTAERSDAPSREEDASR